MFPLGVIPMLGHSTNISTKLLRVLIKHKFVYDSAPRELHIHEPGARTSHLAFINSIIITEAHNNTSTNNLTRAF